MLRKRIFSFILAIGLVLGDIAPAYGYSDISGEKAVPETEILEIKANGYRPVDLNYEVGNTEEYGSDYEGFYANEYDALKEKYIPELSTIPDLRCQDPYGTCWAHAAIANAELSMMKKGLADKNVNYSESQIAYFSYNTVNDPLGGLTGDRNSAGPDYVEVDIMDLGGNSSFIGPVMASWVGAASESDDAKLKYDYVVENYNDYVETVLPDALCYLSDAHLENYYYVDIKENRDAAKKLILDNGAICCSFCSEMASSAYHFIYNSYYYPDYAVADHSVAIVGWDDTYPAENFKTTAPGDGAWLVRNSWMDDPEYPNAQHFYGYFWMSYYEATLEDIVYSFDFEPADNYDNNYQYDGSMYSAYFDDNDDIAAANIFTVMANKASSGNTGETLEAVSFATSETNEEYTIYIYKNPENGKPESGELLSQCTTTGITSYAGYYTVELNEGYHFNYGDRFSVVVKLHKEGLCPNIMIEDSVMDSECWFNCAASSLEGQSFLYNNGNWYDLNKSGYGNVRIKAFTVNGNDFATGIEVSGDTEITVNETGNLTATVTGKGDIITADAVWTSSDETVATVNEGVVTGHNIGTVTITASYGAFSESVDITVMPLVEITGLGTITLSWPAWDEISSYSVTRTITGGEVTFWQDINNPDEGNVTLTDETLVEIEDGFEVRYDISVIKSLTEHTDSFVVISLGDLCSISYEMGPGTNNDDNPASYREGVGEFTLLDPDEVSGYEFDGWYSDSLFKNKITKAYTTESTGDLTIYAHYVPKEYEVYLRYPVLENGEYWGSKFASPVKVEYGSRINFLVNALPYWAQDETHRLPSDYIVGWYTDERCVMDEEYRLTHPEYEIKNGDTYTDAELDRVYAAFKSEKVTLNGNGATLEDDSFYVWKYGKMSALENINPTRTYCNFLGWFTALEGGIQVTGDLLYSDVNVNTLYAHWEKQTYKVEFDAAEGTCDIESKQVVPYEKLGELPVPRRYMYDFAGWYYGENPVDEETVLDNDTETITLTAHWTLRKLETSGVVPDISGGEVETGTRISLSTETQGARIYYTLDDSVGSLVSPDTGILYEDSIIINADTGLYAIAVKEGYDDSEVRHWIYTVKVDPEDWGEVETEDLEEKGITAADMIPSGLWAAGIKAYDYTGNAITQDTLHVYYGKRKLISGTDYTIKYKNNIKAGENTALITITGKGNFTGTIKEYFTINPLDLVSIDASAEDVILKYNGKVQKGKTVVRTIVNEKSVTLKAGTDYEYIYPEGLKEAGEYEVTVMGKGNYSGTISWTEVITELKLLSKAKISQIKDLNYTGEKVEPEFTVTDGKLILNKDTDYRIISTGENIYPGEGYLILEGMGNYTGTKKVTFKIKGTALNKVKYKGFDSSVEYNGNEIKQDEFFFYVGTEDNRLTENVDYTCTYTNNKEVGTATVVYTGINGYTGSLKKTFKITGISIKGAVADSVNDQVFSGDAITPRPLVRLGEVYLVPGRDIEYSYSKNINKGTGKISIKGINGYTGTINKSFKIVAASIKTAEIHINNEYVYTKGGVKPVPVISLDDYELISGKDFSLSYKNNTKPGMGKVVITGKSNFKDKLEYNFDIKNSMLSNTTLSISNIVYKNAAGLCKPSITIKDSNGNKLAAGTDYEKAVTYTYTDDIVVKQFTDSKKKETKDIIRCGGDPVDSKDIIPAGTVIKAIISGKGNYGSSTVSQTFKYVAADMSKAKVTVKAQNYTGKVLEPNKDEITVKVGNITLNKTDYVIKGYSNNTGKGTGKVEIAGVGNYGGTKTASFKINARTFNYTVKYDKNCEDATGSMKNSSFSSWTVLRKNAFKRKGFSFAGWNTRADGTGDSYSNLEVFRIKTGFVVYGKEITLYAQWEPKE